MNCMNFEQAYSGKNNSEGISPVWIWLYWCFEIIVVVLVCQAYVPVRLYAHNYVSK